MIPECLMNVCQRKSSIENYEQENTSMVVRILKSFIKGSISLKNRHFVVQERFNKLIHGINTIKKCGTWQPVKFQLVSRSWNDVIFLSYLWINVANINSNIW